MTYVHPGFSSMAAPYPAEVLSEACFDDYTARVFYTDGFELPDLDMPDPNTITAVTAKYIDADGSLRTDFIVSSDPNRQPDLKRLVTGYRNSVGELRDDFRVMISDDGRGNLIHKLGEHAKIRLANEGRRLAIAHFLSGRGSETLSTISYNNSLASDFSIVLSECVIDTAKASGDGIVDVFDDIRGDYLALGRLSSHSASVMLSSLLPSVGTIERMAAEGYYGRG